MISFMKNTIFYMIILGRGANDVMKRLKRIKRKFPEYKADWGKNLCLKN